MAKNEYPFKTDPQIPLHGGSSRNTTLDQVLEAGGRERRRPDSNRGIADLQSAALPLGYGAVKVDQNCQLHGAVMLSGSVAQVNSLESLSMVPLFRPGPERIGE